MICYLTLNRLMVGRKANNQTKERESLTGLQYRQNNTEKQRLAVRVAKRRLKALTLGLVHEDWTEQQLIDTYGTVCYLCNKEIDFDAPKCGVATTLSKVNSGESVQGSVENTSSPAPATRPEKPLHLAW